MADLLRIVMLALGGALGTLARYGVNGFVSRRPPHWLPLLPLGTLSVNVAGCFAIGFIAYLSDPSLGRAWLPARWRDFLMIGLCGGFTTFSSYGLQVLELGRDGEWLWAGANIAVSNTLCIFAVYLGRVAALALQARFHGGNL